jgi:hypothetical protein
MTFGNDFTYDESVYSFSSGETVTVCRDDATSFDSAIITDNAQLSSTVTLYIPAAAIRYIRLEITVPESLEYSDTIITGTYKAYYTYNTSRDVYTEEGIIIENFPATGDGSAEVTEIFTFTKYGLEATAEVVRGKLPPVIIATYKPTSSGTVTLLGSSFDLSVISNLSVDGVDKSIGRTISLSAGTHKVRFEINVDNAGLSAMFGYATTLTEVDFTGVIGVEIKSMKSIFQGCSKLTTVKGLDKCDISKITTLVYMFDQCESISNFDFLKNLDVSKVERLTSAFRLCTKIENADFMENWNTSNLNHAYELFRGCSSLSNADGMRNLDLSKVTSFGRMFYECTSLTSVTFYSNLTSMVERSEIFYSIKTTGTFYHKGQSRYSKVVAALPSTWTAVQVS